MANKRVQFRRGTTAEHSSFTGAAGEVTVDLTNTSLRVHDNSTTGGVEMSRADLSNIAPSAAVDMNAQRVTNVGTPTQTSDVATKAYVDASFAGGNLSQLTDVTLGTLASGEVVVYDGSSWVNIAVSGDAALASDGALTISDNAINAAKLANDAVDTDAVQDAAITNVKLANSVIAFTDGVTASSISLGGSFSFSGTANEIEVAQSGGELTIGLPDDVNVAGNLTVDGNLVVNGTLTTVNTQTIELQDNIITLNSGTTGAPTENAGIEVDRGDENNVVLRFNETSDEWEVTTDGVSFHELAHSGNVSSVTTAMLVADAVTNAKLADNAVETANIADSNVTAAKLATNAVYTAALQGSAVTTSKIADSNVTTVKLADLNVTTGKLADDAVTPAKASFVNDALASTSGHLMVGDGSVFSNVAMSGDATLLSSGTLTIANSAVTTVKIDDSAVTTGKLGADAVTNAKLADNAVQTENIVDSHVTTAKIADDAVTPAKASFIHDSVAATSAHLLMGDGSVFSNVAMSGDASINASGTLSISAGAVVTDKLGADAVTNAKLADNAVQTENIADGNVTTGKLAADAVTNAKLADDAVQTANLVNASVTTEKLADDAVTPAKISVLSDALLSSTAQRFLFTQDAVSGYQATELSGDISVSTTGVVSLTANSVITADITDANVTTAKIADANVTEGKLASSSVTTAKIADANVTTAKLADDSVTQAKIGAGAVGTTELATDAVTSAKITDANVTTAKIADSNVTTVKLADDSVTQAKIALGAVGTTELAANAVTASKIDSAVAGAGLSGGNGSALSVDVDDVTVELNGGSDIAIKDSGVTTSKIADANVTTAKLANSSVTTDKINAAAVTTSLLADGAVTNAKITDSTISNDKLANKGVTISANSGTPDAILLGETLAIIGTTNEVETAVSANQLQIGLPNDVTISNNLTVIGEAAIDGNTTIASGDFEVSLGDVTAYGFSTSRTFNRINLGGTGITARVLENLLILGNTTVETNLTVQGGMVTEAGVQRAVVSLTESDTLDATHHIVFTSGAITITLPAASSHTGREYVLRNTDGSEQVTLASSSNIDGVSGGSVVAGANKTLVSDGTAWWTVASGY
jgi:hypothetical protein